MTSNRSEASVGYATMDGDTAGSIAPIAGIDKAFLRSWLVWLERSGPGGVGCLAALRAVNVQEPTAELRPLSSHQTDEGDLMPYVVLDRIERMFLAQRLSVSEIPKQLAGIFPEYSEEQLKGWTRKFFSLWSKNQWKRERFAPSFHLDDHNVDPRSWCRFPILSGGFSEELSKL